MISGRLYPPNIAGTLPSFYKTIGGTTRVVVPFSMNAGVSALSVRGLRMRIKETATNLMLGQVDTNDWGESEGQMMASFSLPDSIVNKLVIGNHYKIQIAYLSYQTQGGTTTILPGYFSTVAIVKFTSKPSVTIMDMQEQGLNSINTQQVIGSYENGDVSEKVYQYRFLVSYSTGGLIEDSGWLLHNSYDDTDLEKSSDTYVIKNYLFAGFTYQVQYIVLTNNGLEASSVIYQIAKGSSTGAQLGISLLTELDYDNGRVKLFIPDPKDYPNANYKMDLPQGILSGTFILTRASSETQFQEWEILANFSYQQHFSKFIYWDYTVSAGVHYRYALQKYNSSAVFSEQVLSNIIEVFFEDIFLFDGQRQLKVRYNPKVSSFKEIVSEAKKTTLGSKFPFIIRNGAVNYKEFPINGLLSYTMDNDSLFMSKEELNLPDNFELITDITDQNMAIEKNFKLKALSWLNDGNIKLFRSPQEGTYIVRLMNIALTPNDSLSRMLHSFSCVATQVSDFSVEKLEEYHLSSPGLSDRIYATYDDKPISLRDLVLQHIYAAGNNATVGLQNMANYDLTQGKEVLAVTIEYAPYGAIFQWGQDYNFIIGASGSYTIERDTPAIAPLYLLNPVQSQRGEVRLKIIGDKDQKFEITSQKMRYNYLGYSVYGPDLIDLTASNINHNGQLVRTDNLLQEFNNYSQDMETMFVITYAKMPEFKSTTPGLSPEEYALRSLKVELPWLVNRAIIVTYENQYYLITGVTLDDNGVPIDVTVKEIVDYKNRFKLYFGDLEPIDLIDYSYGDISATVTKGIPKKANGEYYFAVGGGVLAEIYFQGSFTKFSIEDENEEIATLALEADRAYRDYLIHLYQLRSSTTEDSIYMIYNNRLFSYITEAQAKTTYLYEPKYSPKGFSESLYTDDAINQYKNAWITANTQLSARLKAYVKEGK